MSTINVLTLVGLILVLLWTITKIFTKKKERKFLGMEVPIKIGVDRGALLYFRSNYCRMCITQDKILERIRNKVKVIEIDVSTNPELVRSLNVFATPTFLVVKDGQVMKAKVGLQNLNVLKNLIEELHDFTKTGG